MKSITGLTLIAMTASLFATDSAQAVTVVLLDRHVEATVFFNSTETSDQLGVFDESVADGFGLVGALLLVQAQQNTTLEFGGPGGLDLLGFGNGLGSVEESGGSGSGNLINGMSSIDLTFTDATKFSLADLDLDRAGGNTQVVARLTEVGGVDLFNLTTRTTDFSTMLALDPSKQYQLFIQAQARDGGNKSATYTFGGLEITSAPIGVPEPTTAALGLLGVLTVTARRRHRRSLP